MRGFSSQYHNDKMAQWLLRTNFNGPQTMQSISARRRVEQLLHDIDGYLDELEKLHAKHALLIKSNLRNLLKELPAEAPDAPWD